MSAVSSTFSDQLIKWPKVLLLGDSITEYSFSSDGQWASIIANKLIRIADIVNRGAEGYTTSQYKNILDSAMDGIETESIAAVIIELGTNNGWKKTGIENYIKNLDSIVNRLNVKYKISNDKFILICPPPVYENSDGLIPQVVAQYSNACLDYSMKSSLNAIDAYALFSSDPRGAKLFVDGIHFLPEGAKLFADTLFPQVKKLVIKSRGDLERNFPPYDAEEN